MRPGHKEVVFRGLTLRSERIRKQWKKKRMENDRFDKGPLETSIGSTVCGVGLSSRHLL